MRRRIAVLACLCVLFGARSVSGYSVLTHEAIVDTVWDSSIAPVLRSKFGASAAALRQARAYAYGGALIPDMGYYPMSSRFFGDLLHYVRSGDFVEALVREARNTNELAFALGALAHYAADNYGHPLAVNPSVPLIFPKLGRKYGKSVTYEDDHTSHLRTEFGFDVVQVARGKYASDAFHDFIGFEVSKPLLERAFKATYGLELDDAFGNVDVSIGTFRWAVGSVIPELTKAAWIAKHDEIEKLVPGVTRERFTYSLTRADYEKEWGTDYRRPNVGHRLLAGLIRILPKIGPLKPLAFKAPTPEAEKLFLSSLNTVVTRYRELLADAGRGALALTDRNYDTGRPVRAGEYTLADEAYAELVERLGARKFTGVSPTLRARLLSFYSDLTAPIATKEDRHEWQELLANLRDLRAHAQ